MKHELCWHLKRRAYERMRQLLKWIYADVIIQKDQYYLIRNTQYKYNTRPNTFLLVVSALPSVNGSTQRQPIIHMGDYVAILVVPFS